MLTPALLRSWGMLFSENESQRYLSPDHIIVFSSFTSIWTYILEFCKADATLLFIDEETVVLLTWLWVAKPPQANCLGCSSEGLSLSAPSGHLQPPPSTVQLSPSYFFAIFLLELTSVHLWNEIFKIFHLYHSPIPETEKTRWTEGQGLKGLGTFWKHIITAADAYGVPSVQHIYLP